MTEKIKVLVVDDSLFIRTILSDMLSSDPEISIVGTAKDGREAVDLCRRLGPDVVTMDLVMPNLDGLHALERIVSDQRDVSVIMLSASDRANADAVIRCLDIGAFDFIMKPESSSSTDILRMKWEIVTKIKTAFRSGKRIVPESREEVVRLVRMTGMRPKQRERVVAIGASTGGPVALRWILAGLPENLPAPVVIAQHMPRSFTRSFASRLDKQSRMRVKEACDGEPLRAGTAYLGPGESHMEIGGSNGELIVKLTSGERIRGGRPSVDILFTSVAETMQENSIGVILTGMGSDGARGIRRIKDLGGLTIAQDEPTSLVWSMPRAAVRLEAIDKVLPLNEIPVAILSGMGVGG